MSAKWFLCLLVSVCLTAFGVIASSYGNNNDNQWDDGSGGDDDSASGSGDESSTDNYNQNTAGSGDRWSTGERGSGMGAHHHNHNSWARKMTNYWRNRNICHERKLMYVNASVIVKKPCKWNGRLKKTNMTYNMPPVLRRRCDGSIVWCYYRQRVRVKVLVTYRKCCPGWRVSVRGRCDIRLRSKCSVNCLNGGVCNPRKNICVCRRGYNGSSCEIPVCERPCRNGGRCTRNHTCECPRSFTGARCEIPSCRELCQNGGTCVVNGLCSQCICPDGFSGEHCQWGRKPDPKPRGCYYNGQRYQVGGSFNVKCKMCTCLQPRSGHKYGGASCTQVPCPICAYNRTINIPGRCCPLCINRPPSKPLGYTRPTFDNCPEEGDVLLVNLTRGERSVTLDGLIGARDFRGRAIKVGYSVRKIFYKSSQTPEDNLREVVALATDKWRGESLCQFIVRVRDPIPPRFIYCPEDVFHNFKRPAVLPAPIAKDNIGLVLGTPRCDVEEAGQKWNLVTCVAVDYEGNEAYCQFAIHHHNKGADNRAGRNQLPLHERRHRGHERRHDRRHHNAIIGASTAAAVVLILAIALFVCYRRRHRRERQSVQPEIKTPKVVDGIPMPDHDPPPAYESAIKDEPVADNDVNEKRVDLSREA